MSRVSSLKSIVINAPRVYVGNPAKNLTLKEVLSKAPDIHVYSRDGVTVLKNTNPGARSLDKPISENFIVGQGSKENPFTVRGSMDVNPHNVIVALWLRSLDYIFQSSKPIFIEINDWTLQVKPEGVTAEDGHFTKLLPD